MRNQKVEFVFQFSVSASKSLPMFLKRTTHRFPSGYTCGAFSQTCAARVASAQRPGSMNPCLDGWGKILQIYPAGNVQLTASAQLVPFLLVHIRASSFLELQIKCVVRNIHDWAPSKSMALKWSFWTTRVVFTSLWSCNTNLFHRSQKCNPKNKNYVVECRDSIKVIWRHWKWISHRYLTDDSEL